MWRIATGSPSSRRAIWNAREQSEVAHCHAGEQPFRLRPEAYCRFMAAVLAACVEGQVWRDALLGRSAPRVLRPQRNRVGYRAFILGIRSRRIFEPGVDDAEFHHRRNARRRIPDLFDFADTPIHDRSRESWIFG